MLANLTPFASDSVHVAPMIFVRPKLWLRRRFAVAALALLIAAVMLRIAPAQIPGYQFDLPAPSSAARQTDPRPVPRGNLRVAQRSGDEKSASGAAAPADSTAAAKPEAVARSEQQAAVLKRPATAASAALGARLGEQVFRVNRAVLRFLEPQERECCD